MHERFERRDFLRLSTRHDKVLKIESFTNFMLHFIMENLKCPSVLYFRLPKTLNFDMFH